MEGFLTARVCTVVIEFFYCSILLLLVLLDCRVFKYCTVPYLPQVHHYFISFLLHHPRLDLPPVFPSQDNTTTTNNLQCPPPAPSPSSSVSVPRAHQHTPSSAPTSPPSATSTPQSVYKSSSRSYSQTLEKASENVRLSSGLCRRIRESSSLISCVRCRVIRLVSRYV